MEAKTTGNNRNTDSGFDQELLEKFRNIIDENSYEEALKLYIEAGEDLLPPQVRFLRLFDDLLEHKPEGSSRWRDFFDSMATENECKLLSYYHHLLNLNGTTCFEPAEIQSARTAFRIPCHLMASRMHGAVNEYGYLLTIDVIQRYFHR